MVEVLVDNPLLLLFLVAGIGYPLGQIRIGGTSLGIGAVLFVGLAIGALHPDLKLPEIVYLLGLVLFVYTIGLSSGPSFFESLRGPGLRANGAAALVLAAAGALAYALGTMFGLGSAATAGVFAGSLTNTPALAAAVDYLEHRPPAIDAAAPTVAYSLAYPFGILGVILSITLWRRLLGIRLPQGGGARGGELEVATVRVTAEGVRGRPIGELLAGHGWRAVFGRVKRGDEQLVATEAFTLQPGDLVTVVGAPADLALVIRVLGEATAERIDLDRRGVDHRRIFVSSRDVAGRAIRDLHLPSRFGAVVTRVRRGDVEFLPTGATVLQLGDRLRVLTYTGRMADVSRFFGDSFKAISEIDVLSFSLGLLAGLAVGLVPVPLPGGLVFRLGLAGGPLIVALVLGRIGRTGPMVWTLPFNANLTLRQFGLLLFLAGIGTRAGYDFFGYLASGRGLPLLLAGMAVTTMASVAMLAVGHFVLRVPFATLTGMVAAVHTQPAVLAFALEQSHDEEPNVGYATVFPLATLAKVLIAQVLAAG